MPGNAAPGWPAGGRDPGVVSVDSRIYRAFLTVLELISETASNLRTLIFGEFPNLHCENARC